jgi:hypothetical protein
MLSEFALIPKVLDAPDPQSADLHETCIVQLADLLLNDGMVRDLRDGGWREEVRHNLGELSVAGAKLFQSLVQSGRLRKSAATELPPSEDADGWLYEALRSHQDSPSDQKLTAVLAPHDLAEAQADSFIVSVQRMHKADWWQARSCSVRLDRRTSDYLHHLGPVLRHSNSLMFIDPNLDPTKPNYAEFGRLLAEAVRSGTATCIEIHRSCKDSGEYPTRNQWIARFQPLAAVLRPRGIVAKVFVWQDFHDRYLISNLIGISVPHGFDICTDEHRFPLRTTWTRLSRRDADDVQREYDKAAHQGRLRFEPFAIEA